jgi:hypothetical protein
MFEQKARNAEAAGAYATVVINNEDTILSMMGLQKVSDTMKKEKTPKSEDDIDESTESGPSSKDQQSATPRDIPTGFVSEDEYDTTQIPTVMVGSQAGDDMIETVRAWFAGREDVKDSHSRRKQKEPVVSVDVMVTPAFLQGPLYGYEEYPQALLAHQSIAVMGTGSWGVLMTAVKDGEDFQLFLLDKETILSLIRPSAVIIRRPPNSLAPPSVLSVKRDSANAKKGHESINDDGENIESTAPATAESEDDSEKLEASDMLFSVEPELDNNPAAVWQRYIKRQCPPKIRVAAGLIEFHG